MPWPYERNSLMPWVATVTTQRRKTQGSLRAWSRSEWCRLRILALSKQWCSKFLPWLERCSLRRRLPHEGASSDNGKCVMRIHLIKGLHLFSSFVLYASAMGWSGKKVMQIWNRYWTRGMGFLASRTVSQMGYKWLRLYSSVTIKALKHQAQAQKNLFHIHRNYSNCTGNQWIGLIFPHTLASIFFHLLPHCYATILPGMR